MPTVSDLSGNAPFPAQISGELYISSTATGDITVVGASPGRKIYIERLEITVDIASVVQIKSGSTIKKEYNLGATGGIVLDKPGKDTPPWFISGEGEAFIVNNASATNIDIMIRFKVDG